MWFSFTDEQWLQGPSDALADRKAGKTPREPKSKRLFITQTYQTLIKEGPSPWIRTKKRPSTELSACQDSEKHSLKFSRSRVRTKETNLIAIFCGLAFWSRAPCKEELNPTSKLITLESLWSEPTAPFDARLLSFHPRSSSGPGLLYALPPCRIRKLLLSLLSFILMKHQGTEKPPPFPPKLKETDFRLKTWAAKLWKTQQTQRRQTQLISSMLWESCLLNSSVLRSPSTLAPKGMPNEWLPFDKVLFTLGHSELSSKVVVSHLSLLTNKTKRLFFFFQKAVC